MVSFSWYTDFAINYYWSYIDGAWELIKTYVTGSVILDYVVFIVIVAWISWIFSVLFMDY